MSFKALIDLLTYRLIDLSTYRLIDLKNGTIRKTEESCR